MIIIGIDPGTATTGYGVVKIDNKSYNCVDYGVIRTPKDLEQQKRLAMINSEIGNLLDRYRPKALAIETIYFFKNSKTAIPVSHARGVILMTTAQKNIPVYEFTPLQAKSAVVGYGRADKNQVQEMVKIILRLKEIPRPNDAADALAIAICCIRKHYKMD